MSSEAFLDPRFAALPQLLRDATNPELTPADVRRFMDRLLCIDGALFAGALQFVSRERHGFVLVHETGANFHESSAWPRWPLERLFASHRASVITNPRSQQRGLAVPFAFDHERHVVVAPIAVKPDASQTAFLKALQAVTVASPPPAVRTERVPRFAWLGADAELGKRIGRLCEKRGWPLLPVPTFGQLLMVLKRDSADVALIESTALGGAHAALRSLRRAGRIADVPVVYFCNGALDDEIRALTDHGLALHASEADLLNALKHSARTLALNRTESLCASVARMEAQMQSCATLDDLAKTCAQGALQLGFEQAAVLIADEHSFVHAAQIPDDGTLTEHWPVPFITGERLTYSHVSDRFYGEAFDDPHVVRRLRALDPVSAAVLPIGEGEHIYGTITALSLHHAMYEPEFRALAELSDRTARAAARFRCASSRAERSQHVQLGEFLLDLYAGDTSRVNFAVAFDGENAAIAGLEDDSRNAAAIARELLDGRVDPWTAMQTYGGNCGVLFVLLHGESLSYVCAGMPLPLRVPAKGPVPAMQVARRCEQGGFNVPPDSSVLLSSNELASEVETAEIVTVVQRGLRKEHRSIAEAVCELPRSRKKISFAAITRRSSAARAPHQPASL